MLIAMAHAIQHGTFGLTLSTLLLFNAMVAIAITFGPPLSNRTMQRIFKLVGYITD